MSIELPEPFRSALDEGRPRDVADAPAETADARFARGLAREQTGDEAGARSDFEAALPEVGDAARVELVLLDIRERVSYEASVRSLREAIRRAERGSRLYARAQHVLGLVHGKRRQTADAVDALLKSVEAYRVLEDSVARSTVYDTLGQVYAAQGLLDYAQSYFGLSLVGKSLAGDRYGTAITLGNLGRVHLRAGRFAEAVDCFELDLKLAEELGDERGCVRMLEDLGRTYLARGDSDAACRFLKRSIERAAAAGYVDLEFFARKDLALAHLEADRGAEAKAELDLAEKILPEGADPYLSALLLAARGDLLRRAGDRRCLGLLKKAAQQFEEADLPDARIETLLRLAEACAELTSDPIQGRQFAEVCLRDALRIAEADGFSRFLRPIREQMQRLEVTPGLTLEESRLPEGEHSEATPDGYTLLGRVGEGGFGTVYRAFDPLRSRIVAIKRLRFEQLYDLKTRNRYLTSAKIELEAASKIRHPGIARVHAIGRDRGGGTYVVQDYVEGRALRQAIPSDPSSDCGVVLGTVGAIANALSALHDRNVFHRDLKPENVMLRGTDDMPVLIDFGIAYVPRLADQQAQAEIAGTLEYMAPEQMQGKSGLDGKADVYSLGVIFYEWLTGERPLRRANDDVADFLTDLVRKSPPPLEDLRPGLPADVVDLVGSMLEKKASGRPSAIEVAASCARIAGTVAQTRATRTI